MSELLPYEEQLAGRLANIPLPDEDKGWDAMRKMLEEDDDGVVPPPPNTGCRNRGLLGLMLLLLLAGLTVGVYKMVTNKQGSKGTENSAPANKPFAPSAGDSSLAGHANKKADPITPPIAVGSPKAAVGNMDTTITPPIAAGKPAKLVSKPLSSFDLKKAGVSTAAVAGGSGSKKGVFAVKTKGSTVGDGSLPSKKHEDAEKIKITNPSVDTTKEHGGPDKTAYENGKLGKIDSVKLPFAPAAGSPVPKASTTSSITTKNIDSVPAKPSMAKIKPAKKDSAISKGSDGDEENTVNQIYFSGGLGLQQLIPIDGQKANPYNAYGRKSSLADYIPSVYFRVHQNRKFLQVEFKYGAPQYTKDVAYSTQVLHYDSTTHITSSTVNHLNKTYYHQLPISLHYSILPSLSIGAGVVWNKFQSAVVTQENHSSNGLTGTDSVLSAKVVNVKSDSGFSKTYWQFMLETQYTWRHFSLGVRYAWGLTPYLSYTSPTTGQTQKERNASLNIFLRYELWSSKKK